MTNRKLAALETRKKIVEAAKQLLETKAFEDISIEDITEQAGVATGSFYTYFKKKEAIIEEISDRDFYRLAEITNSLKDKSIEEKINYYSKRFLSEIEKVGIEICRQWTKNNLAPSPMYLKSDTSKYEHDYNALKSILDYAVKNNELIADTPTKDLALFINSQLYGLMISWCMSDGKVVGSKQIDKYCKLIVSNTLKTYLKGAKK